jgi:hypothetical protein
MLRGLILLNALMPGLVTTQLRRASRKAAKLAALRARD